MDNPQFVKPWLVQDRGSSMIRFRNAEVEDARFILSLRTDPTKNEHLSPVADDLEAQKQWLERYSADPEQIYFIIEHWDRCGTVRLYNRRGNSFEWGSWILNSHAPRGAARITTLMVYAFALELGFSASHFQVRKGNEKVWRYHEAMGAERVDETEDSHHYEIKLPAILRALMKHRDRMPGVEVIPLEARARVLPDPVRAV